MKFCIKCNTQIEDDNQNVCPNCGETLSEEIKSTPAFPMKWYKFLIYFALFASALLNLGTGIRYITGNIYTATVSGVEINADLVYGVYGDGLKTLDIIFGIAVIAVAVFCIYTRFRLAGYKANAPMCISALYLINALLNVAYGVAVLLITEVNNFSDPSTITSIVISLAFFVYNRKYFKERESLFVN